MCSSPIQLFVHVLMNIEFCFAYISRACLKEFTVEKDKERNENNVKVLIVLLGSEVSGKILPLAKESKDHVGFLHVE